MSIDPQAIWSERFGTIGQVIEKNADLLVERWSVRAMAEQDSAERVHHEQLRDSLPELMRNIGAALAASTTDGRSGHRQVAKEHGQQRWQVGWRLAEVVRDYQILRLVILEFLEATLSDPPQTRECMAIGLALDEAIGASVAAYVRNQDTQLRTTQERMTEFLAVLSHELRDPLAPLHTALEVVRRDDGIKSAPMQEAVHSAQRSLEHITRLVDDLLDVSRVTAGKLALAKQNVPLAEIVQRALALTAPLRESRRHTLELHGAESETWLHADSLRLTQVLVNVLNNAAKYTPPGGRIQVLIDREPTDVRIRVRDNGIGISPELLPHIFEFFVQADTGTARTTNGLGIGLALVSRLVELHGGSIAATSPGPGGGSEFTVRLPCVVAADPDLPEDSTVATTAGSKGGSSATKRVLVVDDNQDGALMLAMFLQSCGHQVETAHSAEDAMHGLVQHQPDVVILDIGLPHTDGYAVAQQMRASTAGQALKLIALTGYGHEEDRKRAFECGFDEHLVKPVKLEQLRTLLAGKSGH